MISLSSFVEKHLHCIKKGILWIDPHFSELCSHQGPELDDFNVLHINQNSLSNKTWEPFYKAQKPKYTHKDDNTTPDRSKCAKNLIVAIKSQFLLNALRHGLVKLSSFDYIVIGNPHLCYGTKKHGKNHLDPVSDIFNEFYWRVDPKTQDNRIDSPKVVSVWNSSILAPSLEKTLKTQGKLDKESINNIPDIIEYFDRFNLESLILISNKQTEAIPTFTIFQTHSDTTKISLNTILKDELESIRQEKYLTIIGNQILTLFEKIGKFAALSLLSDFNCKIKEAETSLNNSLSIVDVVNLVKKPKWEKTIEKSKFLSNSISAYISQQTDSDFSQNIETIYKDILPSIKDGESILVVFDSKMEAKFFKPALQHKLQTSHLLPIEKYHISYFNGASYCFSNTDNYIQALSTQRQILISTKQILKQINQKLPFSTIVYHGNIKKISELFQISGLFNENSRATVNILTNSKNHLSIKKLISTFKDLQMSLKQLISHDFIVNPLLNNQEQVQSSRNSTVDGISKDNCFLSNRACWILLHRYIHVFPSNYFPKPGISWICSFEESQDHQRVYTIEARLPLHSSIYDQIIISTSSKSFKIAKEIASSKIIRLLIDKNAFDEKLCPSLSSLPAPFSLAATFGGQPKNVTRQPIPLLTSKWIELNNVGQKVDAKCFEAHLLIIQISHSASCISCDSKPSEHGNFGIISPIPLLYHDTPMFECYDKQQCKQEIVFRPASKPVLLSTSDLELARFFHIRTLQLLNFVMPLKPSWDESPYQHAIVPLLSNFELDWNSIDATFYGFSTSYPTSQTQHEWIGSVVCFKHSPQQKFHIQNVEFDLNPNSPFPGLIPGQTYVDYVLSKHQFTVSVPDQPLVSAKILSSKAVKALVKATAGITPKKEHNRLETFNPYRSVQLVPEMCELVWKANSTPETALILPSLMHRLEMFLRVDHVFKKLLDIDFVPLEQAQIALTLRSAGESFDLEYFETLGDAILKLLTHSYLTHQYPNMTILQLESHRCYWVSNRTLMRLANVLGLENWISLKGQEFDTWLVPGFQPTAKSNQKLNIADKSVSDCVEAILAVCYLNKGLAGAVHFLAKLGLHELVEPSPAIVSFEITAYPDRYKNLAELERKLKYKWNDKRLLMASVTHDLHPSTQPPHPIYPNYQVLSFLGDSLFDYFVVFKHVPTEYTLPTPGEITLFKSLAVNGCTQAIIATLELDLGSYLVHSNTELQNHIELFTSTVKLNCNLTRPLWQMGSLDYPIAVTTCFEALVGAVFLDCGSNLETTWKVFEPILVPFWSAHVRAANSEAVTPKRMISQEIAQLRPSTPDCPVYIEGVPQRVRIIQAWKCESLFGSDMTVGFGSEKKVSLVDAAAKFYAKAMNMKGNSLSENLLRLFKQQDNVD